MSRKGKESHKKEIGLPALQNELFHGLCYTVLRFEKDGNHPRGQKAFEKPALSLLECGFSVRSCYAYVASKSFTELTLCTGEPRAPHIVLPSNCWSLHLVSTEGRAPS